MCYYARCFINVKISRKNFSFIINFGHRNEQKRCYVNKKKFKSYKKYK